MVVGQQRERMFDKRVQIPGEQRVTADWNKRLMKPVEEDDTRAALRGLHRGKAAGSNELSNDLVKDCEKVFVPRLTSWTEVKYQALSSKV